MTNIHLASCDDEFQSSLDTLKTNLLRSLPQRLQQRILRQTFSVVDFFFFIDLAAARPAGLEECKKGEKMARVRNAAFRIISQLPSRVRNEECSVDTSQVPKAYRK
jgi:hypothetical protein